jgi:hypothetical protein
VDPSSESQSEGVPPSPTPREKSDKSESGFSQRAARLQRELARLLFDLLERKRAAGLVPAAPDRFPLELELEIFAGPGVESPPDQLFEGLRRAVERWVGRTAEFPHGRVYCHWCQSFTCEHSGPHEPRAIFAGYSSTGQPLWRDLAAVLLERRDPRIESLYRDRPSPVTLVQGGGELTRNQLAIYGRHSPIYGLLGQVALGYVLPPSGGTAATRKAAGEPERERDRERRSRDTVSVTFQAVELGGGERIVLNVIGRLEDGGEMFHVLEEAADPRVADSLAAARRNLADLSLRHFPRKRRGVQRRRHAMGILTRLGRQLDRVFRQGRRRTRHSRERHLDRRRPSASAFSDALAAAKEQIYRDVEERTWVVIGPKNRVHVFNDSGMHVTSVVYSGDTIRGRTTRGKWLRARESEREAFQEALRRRAVTEEEEPEG